MNQKKSSIFFNTCFFVQISYKGEKIILLRSICFMVAKVYVTSRLTAVFPCPECGKSENKDVSKFIGHETKIRLKYKCKCGYSFPVDLERRRSIRKNVCLSGFVHQGAERYPIVVEDLSQHGIKISFEQKFDFEKGQKIELEFILDDHHGSKILRQVKIKKIISDMTIGCEFLTAEHYDGLGKYFLFHN